MFSLIITIISIALVAALALATIYYGGSAFNKGSSEAKASQLINEGQQINGAFTMNKADVAAGSAAAVTTLEGLVTASPSYLAQVPAKWALDASNKFVSQVVAADVCKAVNTKAGFTDSSKTVVDGTAALGANDVTGQYGCVVTSGTVFYKI